MAVSILMKKIREEFQIAKSFAENERDDQYQIKLFLSTINSPYLSVSFEAVSFSLAKLDIKDGDNEFTRWKIFVENNSMHSTQIHIGLGWALAFQKLSLSSINSLILPFLICKVADGVGYADGFFKQRATIQLKKEPIGLMPNLIPGYYQGLGRAMWYVAVGDLIKLTHFISSFDDYIIPHLWRGVGIASTYVGGLSQSDFLSLGEILNDNIIYYKVGVVLALQSRSRADTINNFTKDSCTFWLKSNINEIVEQIDEIESKYLNSKEENAYAEFLVGIRNALK
jgi:hypothetical protein